MCISISQAEDRSCKPDQKTITEMMDLDYQAFDYPCKG